MLSMFYSIGRVNGAALMILAWLFWLIAYAVVCWDLHSRRRWPSWIVVAAGALLAELICDPIWFKYYFEGGFYVNHGLIGSAMLLLWPALLMGFLVAALLLKDKLIDLLSRIKLPK